jgi:Flp pilus assembly protein TadD
MFSLRCIQQPICDFRPSRRLGQVRRNRRRGCSYAVVLLLSVVGIRAAPGAASAELTLPPAPFRAPYIPATNDEALQEVPALTDPAVIQMKKLRAAFDAAPQSLFAAKQLADAYIDYSRQIGDAHFAGYAEAIIAPWLRLPRPPAPALVTQAIILQYRHLFAEARVLLQKALKVDPADAQAWLTLGTLDMVQGEYETAAKDCGQLSHRASVEIGLACFASLRSYTGQARESLAALQQLEVGSQLAPATYRAWVQGLLAESAERLGEWGLAESHYRKALDILPQDNFLLVAYADFLLDRARPQEVLPLLANHTQSDTAFLRLALAQSALHSTQTQRYTWIMAARFEALRLRGSDYFGREESRFALQLQHDPKIALDMALRNWQVQRAPWDARVVLEAALATKQPQAATPVLEFLAKTKLEDPILEPMVKALGAKTNSSGAAQ